MKTLCGLLLLGCASSTGPCTPAERSAIGAAYIAELEASCERGKSLSQCAAAPAITERYEKARAEWVLCQRK
jgi:hypothetical protein